MNVIERIRKRHGMEDGVEVGVRSSFGADAVVDTESGNRDLIVVATTDDVDLDDEVVVPSGADTTYFFGNKRIFVDHEYTVDKYVAVLRKAMAYPSVNDHRAWKVRMRVRPGPLGDDVLTIARESGIGSSIGFEPIRSGPPTDDEKAQYAKAGRSPRSVVRQWRWLELSLTAMPCNVMCQGGMASVDSTRAVALDEMVTKGLIRRETARAFGLPDAPKRGRIVVVRSHA